MTSVCPFQEKRIVNMAIVALPIQVMILVSLVRLLFYAVRKCCQHRFSQKIKKAAHPIMGERQEVLSVPMRGE